MKYIKTGQILNLIDKANENNRPLYIQGPIGCGKTAAVEYYYRRISHQVIDCADGKIENKTDPSRIRANVIIFDNVSYLAEDESIKYALDMMKNSGKHVIFISRAPRPTWLISDSIDHEMVQADWRDMRFSKEHVFKLLEQQGVTASEEEKLVALEESRSNPLLLSCIAEAMRETGVYTKEVNTFARINYHNYLDKELLGRLNEEEVYFLLALCWYPRFTYELARKLNGAKDCRHIIDTIQKKNAYILTFSSMGIQFLDPVIAYLRHKRTILWTDEQHAENLCRAAEYYLNEEGNQIQALTCYQNAHAHDEVVRLLTKTAENSFSEVSTYQLKDFYLSVSDEETRQAWPLVASRCMIESIRIRPSASEEWFDCLKDMYKEEKDPEVKDKIGKRIKFLDLMLPHKGTKDLKRRLNMVAEILGNDRNICEGEYIDLMPSILHGSVDFSEMAQSEEWLYNISSDFINKLSSRSAGGTLDILKAEIAYEKESMDSYKLLKMLNRGYMIADADNSCGGCFAAVGVMVHIYLNRGEQDRAEELLDGIRSKAVDTKNDILLGNIDALYGWVDHLHANRESILAWLETAPDEGKGFTFLQRGIMMCKVRAYIILGKFSAALDLIERLLVFCDLYGRIYAKYELMLYKAVVYYRIKNPEAEKILTEVVQKAESLGFYHLVSDHGAAVLSLLETYRPENVSKAFMDRLMRLTRQMAENFPNYLITAEELKDPLTKTEQRVLHLLCEGLTAEEICSIMDISYSGIKFHNKNIYRKLGASNRTEAVRAAFKLGFAQAGAHNTFYGSHSRQEDNTAE